MRRSRAGFVPLVLAIVAAAGCQDDPRRATAGPPCPQDGGCSTVVAGAQGGTGGSGGAGGAAAAVTVTGSVQVLVDSAFTQTQAYAGEATIVADKAGGGSVSVPYGGAAGTTFTLEDVAPEGKWLLVERSGAAAGVLSTFSAIALPPTGPVTLALVDADVMGALAASLPLPIALDENAAQIIVLLTRAGMPLADVELDGAPAGSEIVYDQGAGIYSNDAIGTGSAGAVILLNVPLSSVATDVALHAKDAQGTGFALPVRARAGAATFARFSL